MRKLIFIVQSVIATWLLVVNLDAHAGVPAGYQAYPTDAELINLPAYCKIKLRYHFDAPEYRNLQASFGPDFEHVHHYCAALNYINRYYRAADAEDKKFNLNNALGNFTYMVDHAKPEFILMPEVYMNRATTYSKMKRPANAIIDLEKAISLNPKLARAYNLLADYQIDLKQGSNALITVTEGLRQIPNSKSLQKRYAALGGKLPYPEPYQKPEEQKADEEEKGMTKEVKPNDATPEQSQSSELQPAAPSKVIERPAIGMPGNPWCRFCPDAEDQKVGQTPVKP